MNCHFWRADNRRSWTCFCGCQVSSSIMNPFHFSTIRNTLISNLFQSYPPLENDIAHIASVTKYDWLLCSYQPLSEEVMFGVLVEEWCVSMFVFSFQESWLNSNSHRYVALHASCGHLWHVAVHWEVLFVVLRQSCFTSCIDILLSNVLDRDVVLFVFGGKCLFVECQCRCWWCLFFSVRAVINSGSHHASKGVQLTQ